jgi:hypothetical protein
MRTKSQMLVVLFMLAFMPLSMQAKKMNAVNVAAMTQEQKVEEVAAMQVRVKEIMAMDMSKMSAEERKSLRQELKGMKKEAKDIGGGVYISVGALILIIVLLIILL